DGYTYDFNALNVNVYGSDSYALYVGGGSILTLDDTASLKAYGDNSYAIYANNAEVHSKDNTLNIEGNILSDNKGFISLAFKDSSSSFKGSTSLANSGSIDLSFDNSRWTMTEDSALNNLKLSNNAVIDLTQTNSVASNPINLMTDNILGDGIFNIRVDAGNNASDKIFITNSSSGSHAISFNDKTTGSYNTDNFSLAVIRHMNPMGDYKASFTGAVDIGAYKYKLTFDNNTKQHYVGSVTPSGIAAPPGSVSLNNAAVSSIGFLTINYLSNYINTQNILQRMGELRNNNKDRGDVWTRAYLGKLSSFNDDTRIDSIGYYGLQIGADKLSYINNAKLYAGLTFGYLKSDADYIIGDSESIMYDLGLYALYKDDNSFYIDTLIKYSQNDNSFNTKTSNNLTVDGKGKSRGFSLSVETGKRYDINSIYYIEPQAELTYSKQGSFTINSSNNLKTNIKGFDSYLARVSVILGYRLKDNANLYLKTGYAKELNGKSSYSFNDSANTQKEYKLNQNIFDNAIGFTLNSNSHNVYLEGGLQKGSEFDNLKVNVGYRYGF
ncbi:MAG: autotransporter outer membrane beta-barrel domain-containing protein, partial [Campylobacteraceae bacterium]|nr:autotransporter outer membrane beta-barrel domain-containing protein [Campylobacteraceae bacterium]